MLKKIRFKLLLIGLFLKRNIFFVLVGLAFGSAIFIYKDSVLDFVNSPYFTTKYIGIQGQYNPANLPEEIQNQISYGLTLNSDNDKQLPSPLVDSIDAQNDNKEFIVTLKQDFYWHNGKKFTSSDINYDFDGMQFTPVSPYELKITTDNQFAPIYNFLSRPLLKKSLVGLGPYKVSSVSFQEGYVKSLRLDSTDKRHPGLVYRFYQNEKDLINAFKLGEIDEINISSLPPDLTNWSKVDISQKVQTNNKYLALFFNTSKFSSKQLRQALAYATPKTKDKNERCLSPISPTSWAYNPLVKEYSYDPERAKKLYEKNEIESINITVLDRNLLSLAENIRDTWHRDLNIKVTASLANQIDQNNYDVILAYGGIPHDPDQYLYWHSSQTKTNLTKLNNSRIDKLLEDGRQTFDPIERKRIYFDFQKYLLEESPAIFLSYPNIYTVARLK